MSNTIILVHIGKNYPSYISTCINQLKKYNFNIHLLINKDVYEYVIDKEDINISFIEDYVDEKYNIYMERRSGVLSYEDNMFREGFWKTTTSRFFILENYSRKNNITNFFHMEYDNILYSTLEKENEILKKSEAEMCIVMDYYNRCVPSIIWMKSYEILQRLTNHILNNVEYADMYTLGSFFHSSDTIVNFPIIPTNYSTSSSGLNYANFYNEFNSVFDGIAIGQFLGGVDPMNISGNTEGFINETAILNCEDFEFIWKNKELFGVFGDELFKINNIHVHSKNLEKFV